MPQNSTVDVIGVIFEISALSQIKLKSTNEMKDRCNLVVADDSNFSVGLTLWGSVAVNLQSALKVGDVVAFKSCRVSDYQGKCLNSSSDLKDCCSQVKHPRSNVLQKWFQSASKEQHLQKIESLSQRQEG